MTRPVAFVGTGCEGVAAMIDLADLGWTVHGYDVATESMKRLRRGVSPFREPARAQAFKSHVAAGRLRFFTILEEAVADADVVHVSVETACGADGATDVSTVESALAALSFVKFSTWPTVVIRSTVPPGTCDRLVASVEPWGELLCAPSFVRQGTNASETPTPLRIIVGARKASMSAPYLRLFETLETRIVCTSLCNAELLKACSNAFFAMKTTFANEVANLCDALGADANVVLRGMSYDPGIGSAYLQPGIGLGNPGLEKDVRSIRYVAAQVNVSRELFSATLRANEMQQALVIDGLEQEIGNLHGTTLGVWGFASRSGSTDVRHSFAAAVVNELIGRGADVKLYDPGVYITPLPAGARLVAAALDATDADALIVLTAWPQFAEMNPSLFAPRLRRRLVVDACNALDPAWVRCNGLRYRGTGCPVSSSSYLAAPAV